MSSDHSTSNYQQAVREAAFGSPSVLGRLIAIAALRDRQNDGYRSLADRYGAARIDNILRQLHVETFVTWLNFSLAQQMQDLKVYCNRTGKQALDGLQELVERSIPPGRRDVDRQLVLSDLEVVTALVRAEL